MFSVEMSKITSHLKDKKESYPTTWEGGLPNVGFVI